MQRAVVTGRVVEILPRALYRVAIDGTREIVAHANGGPARNFVRLLVGDSVSVEVSPRDITRDGSSGEDDRRRGDR